MPRQYTGRSLQGKMQIVFGGSVGVLLTIILISCIIVVVVTNNNVADDGRDAIITQTETKVDRVVQGVAAWLRTYINTVQSTFGTLLSESVLDTARTDGYAVLPGASVFDNGVESLPSPTVQSVRGYNNIASVAYTTLFLPASTPRVYTPANGVVTSISAAADVINALNRTKLVEPMMMAAYNADPDIMATYVATQAGGTFRHFPGRPHDNTYDPRGRGWYTDARAADGVTIISSPYPDFTTRRWMITAARNVRRGSIDAVTACDVLLTSIDATISSQRFLTNGKVVLLERATGYVVADPDFNGAVPAPVGATTKTYAELQRPSVSSGLWARVRDTVNLTSVEDVGGARWLVVSRRIEGVAQSKYVMMVTIPYDEILGPMQDVIDDTKGMRDITIVIVVCTFVVVCVVMEIAIVLTSGALGRPLNVMATNVDRMIDNIGHADLTEGVTPVEGSVSEEQEALNTEFNAMVDVLREAREKLKAAQNADMIVNPEYVPPVGGGGAPQSVDPYQQ